MFKDAVYTHAQRRKNAFLIAQNVNLFSLFFCVESFIQGTFDIEKIRDFRNVFDMAD